MKVDSQERRAAAGVDRFDIHQGERPRCLRTGSFHCRGHLAVQLERWRCMSWRRACACPRPGVRPVGYGRQSQPVSAHRPPLGRVQNSMRRTDSGDEPHAGIGFRPQPCDSRVLACAPARPRVSLFRNIKPSRANMPSSSVGRVVRKTSIPRSCAGLDVLFQCSARSRIVSVAIALTSQECCHSAFGLCHARAQQYHAFGTAPPHVRHCRTHMAPPPASQQCR